MRNCLKDESDPSLPSPAHLARVVLLLGDGEGRNGSAEVPSRLVVVAGDGGGQLNIDTAFCETMFGVQCWQLHEEKEIAFSKEPFSSPRTASTLRSIVGEHSEPNNRS